MCTSLHCDSFMSVRSCHNFMAMAHVRYAPNFAGPSTEICQDGFSEFVRMHEWIAEVEEYRVYFKNLS